MKKIPKDRQGRGYVYGRGGGGGGTNCRKQAWVVENLLRNSVGK